MNAWHFQWVKGAKYRDIFGLIRKKVMRVRAFPYLDFAI
jgi:hypothetical protein